MTKHKLYAVGVGNETPLFTTLEAAQEAEAHERIVNGATGIRAAHPLDFTVYDTWEEYATDKDALIRARAIARLTAEERRVLGL